MALTAVTTRFGRLHGTMEDGVSVFRGVPYARPPIADLRFRPPLAPERWAGSRNASRHRPASLQVNAKNQDRVLSTLREITGGKVRGIKNSPPFSSVTYFQDSVDEDCLYCTVWTPAITPADKLPVYVYYHGGANAGSAGSMQLERGAHLARDEGIIVVRPNYRLGALGWVHFGLICNGLTEAVNLGVQDQLAALRWVADAIEAFGGDPDNITVGGESAGATAVSHLLANPEARPLFRRAILQSFTPFNQWSTQLHEDAVDVVDMYLRHLGTRNDEELRKVDGHKLLAINLALVPFFEADSSCAWRPLGGVVDGHFIPEQPVKFLIGGSLPSHLSLMIGFAKDEWQFFRGHSDTISVGSVEDCIAVLAQVFGSGPARMLFESWAAANPGRRPGRILSDIMSFNFFKLPALRIAERVQAIGGRTHLFEFAFDLPGKGGQLGAFHTGDMPFIWRNLSEEDLAKWPAFKGVDVAAIERSAARFGCLYGSFIRTGEPGPSWPCYQSDRTILELGVEVEAKPQLLASEVKRFETTGLRDVGDLEARLLSNLRSAPGIRR